MSAGQITTGQSALPAVNAAGNATPMPKPSPNRTVEQALPQGMKPGRSGKPMQGNVSAGSATDKQIRPGRLEPQQGSTIDTVVPQKNRSVTQVRQPAKAPAPVATSIAPSV